MSELTDTRESLGRLRKWIRATREDGFGPMGTDLETLRGIADELDAELAYIERTYMRLPVDADGVPVRIGDTMGRICAEDRDVFTVGLIGSDGLCMDDETSFFKASECRHVQPDTVEDIIAEVVQFGANADTGTRIEDVVEEYAERIRKAVEHG